MYGKNEITNEFLSDTTILVHSLFPTIQGEGPDAGRPSVFLRLAKCNLRCHFCDTEFDNGSEWSYETLNLKLFGMLRTYGYDLLVITGGEPLLQNLAPIIQFMNDRNIAVSVETAGSVYQDYLDKYFAWDRHLAGNLIVCSPKTPRVHPKLVPLIGAFKYIIRAGEVSDRDGLPIMSTQLEGKEARLFRRPNFPESSALIYVQPCDEHDEHKNHVNLMATVNSSLKFGHRLSLQLHKIAGLD